jgi:hypothetical protein
MESLTNKYAMNSVCFVIMYTEISKNDLREERTKPTNKIGTTSKYIIISVSKPKIQLLGPRDKFQIFIKQ